MYDFTHQYEMSVLINNRNPAFEYHHMGETFIEGRDGSEYTIRLRNSSPEQIGIMLSVDGLSVLDGKPAGLTSPVFVLTPHEVLDVPGWKVDNGTSAAFTFGDKGKSYSNRSGQGTSNVGVIGAMVFRAEPLPHYPGIVYVNNKHDWWDANPAYPWYNAPNSTGNPPNTDWGVVSGSTTTGATYRSNEPMFENGYPLGTSFGDTVDTSYSNTSFQKRDPDHPDSYVVMYYDSARGLEKRGIRLRQKSSAYKPEAFPSYTNNTKGCKPPAGWQK